MVKSMTMASKVPHFHYVEELNCNSLVELKTAFQRQKSDQGVKHTYLPFLIKSLSMALSKYPMLNSSFIEETNEVLLKGLVLSFFKLLQELPPPPSFNVPHFSRLGVYCRFT